MSYESLSQCKCYYCDAKERLEQESIQVKGEFILVNLCPKHYAEHQAALELTRSGYRRQFGENWH